MSGSPRQGRPEPFDPDRILATYRIEAGGADPEAAARAIAIEQTVEIPERLIPPGRIRDEIVGRVESCVPDPEAPGATRVAISYAADFARDLSGLLGVGIGNASMYAGVRLVDLRPPGALLQSLRGPNYGVEGVRRLRGVRGRPLLATALKPRGSTIAELAALAGAFARGGGDLVKDDQNLTDDFETFRERVLRCAEAVENANRASGGGCLYLPHAGAPAEELERFVAFVAEVGLPGVLVCPMIVGLDTPPGAGGALSARLHGAPVAHRRLDPCEDLGHRARGPARYPVPTRRRRHLGLPQHRGPLRPTGKPTALRSRRGSARRSERWRPPGLRPPEG